MVSVIVVVILLMPLRVAEVSAISIPVTIFMALALFSIFGIELNTVTLAALIVTPLTDTRATETTVRTAKPLFSPEHQFLIV